MAKDTGPTSCEPLGATLQQLSDCGLNPFAVQLLVESWKRLPRPVKARFAFQGVIITIEPGAGMGDNTVTIGRSQYDELTAGERNFRTLREVLTQLGCPLPDGCNIPAVVHGYVASLKVLAGEDAPPFPKIAEGP